MILEEIIIYKINVSLAQKKRHNNNRERGEVVFEDSILSLISRRIIIITRVFRSIELILCVARVSMFRLIHSAGFFMCIFHKESETFLFSPKMLAI